MAGGLGFEPRLDESESSVLPLDDPPILLRNHTTYAEKKQASVFSSINF